MAFNTINLNTIHFNYIFIKEEELHGCFTFFRRYLTNFENKFQE